MIGAGRAVLVGGVMLTLAACGAGRLQNACIDSGRAGANPALCGCVQAVADRELDPGERRLAASFYDNPQRAQDIRQSDRPADRRFWDRYTAFAEEVERSCVRLR